MSRLVWPNASSCRTSISRAVRVSARRSRSLAVDSSSARATTSWGSITMLPPATRRTVWIRCSVAGLQDVAARAAADGLDDELAVVVRGQHDDADARVLV